LLRSWRFLSPGFDFFTRTSLDFRRLGLRQFRSYRNSVKENREQTQASHQ
jgi:hypothetical protein